ncbi:precorrin-6y C5,15-methyltransferase (decarboxylating), CbiE subunit [Dethiosulfovibrio peptidovorans DSM 11002]|uniref:Precorrin-6y C5,15-methyltransferase (Decarboxylating), CbiE subunit n=1 Tax=Dethiosulfovibrio peptidovorans DSM 11002 TaxID=469381 RepID=D2Z8F4_9BACT|nr:precorrin-6y C5,15-methyltransferase (decarboxylating) subunit CbiE [Dethiosulfovibrio peptidovorans]EFC91751.1 precorrin-6y C5,15-methyltransferase (decarboxylating), CbiE subunit [Dethiosulfovibrio peptidovorans DSM 11002]
MEKIHIVGVGPGSRNYLLPIALKAIEGSDTLLGSPRVLKMFSDMADKKTVTLSGSPSEALEIISKRGRNERLAVLVSGDPCFFSLGSSLAASLPEDQYEIIPGLSSISLAFSRLGISWQEGTFVSVHGRPLDSLNGLQKETGPIAILTGGLNNPMEVASKLLKIGASDRKCWTMSNLGTDDERVESTNLSDLSEEDRSSWPSLTLVLLEPLS